MKEFMLLIRNEIDHQNQWTTDRQLTFLNKCSEYIAELRKQGKLISAQPLIREGKMISGTKGSWKESAFNDSKEVIVGYYHLLANDMEDAMAIAKQNPEFEYGTKARVEIRPVKTKEESTKFVYPTNA